MEYLWVGIGGFIGANARFIVGRWIGGRSGDTLAFPVGTLLVNITGSLLIGLALALVVGKVSFADPAWRLLVIVGVLGGYTTFSAFSAETVLLIEDGRTGAAVTYVVATNLLGLLACFMGLAAGRALLR
ncbi:MAG TPA: fluoride efflux transporter CrcB [Thermomicrobiales bacterium]|nr:fluoride efflux transporter CrcB [Thermomicrobiales bacterium]